MATATQKPKPVLQVEYCKGCGRCIDACAKHCIEAGTEIHAGTGLAPVLLHLEDCSGCGLCFAACPEPYGLLPEGVRETARAPEAPVSIPDRRMPLPRVGARWW